MNTVDVDELVSRLEALGCWMACSAWHVGNIEVDLATALRVALDGGTQTDLLDALAVVPTPPPRPVGPVAAPQPCNLYIMRSGDLMKIGIASDVDRRRRALSAARGQLVDVLRTAPFISREAARAAETDMHREFAAIRALGEWFQAHDAILASFDACWVRS